ncbi:hypothetical protein [Roseofilum capinflatum]|uniref:Uncharacterized protein n=1 Tax=Roseofilum capinflatum BLCC-M114 TaxID=3022440 RepID=A0ABT7B6C1_9CYAN|nr:hypothetical protein [Roseofilum capinflatum]MDJ1174081.1 hypothetical protein [Roseofilum capinflatum BLCC-M114]
MSFRIAIAEVMMDYGKGDRPRDGWHYRPQSNPETQFLTPCANLYLLIPKDRETPASPQHSVRGHFGE